MPSGRPWLVDEQTAAYYAGRPRGTIRRWAHEGRITRHGHGWGNVRYDARQLPAAQRDDDTGQLITPGATPPMPEALQAA